MMVSITHKRILDLTINEKNRLAELSYGKDKDSILLWMLEKPKKSGNAFIAKLDNQIVGWAGIYRLNWNPAAYDMHMFVDIELRGKGIGTKLYLYAMDHYRHYKKKVFNPMGYDFRRNLQILEKDVASQ